MRYWVLGGEYRDTRFQEIMPGQTEERYGPYPDYGSALREWERLARATIDNCHARYTIRQEEAA